MLYQELLPPFGGNSTFGQFSDGHLWGGAFYLAKYRIYSSGVSRRGNAPSRKPLPEDIRGKGVPAFEEISFPVAPARHVQPTEHAASVREKDVRFALVDIPKALSNFRPEIRKIPGILHPDQELRDWVAKEQAKAKHKDPIRALSGRFVIFCAAASPIH